MESGRWIRGLARGALVASLLPVAAASTASASAAARPTLSKVHVRPLSTTASTATWVLTAIATDRDGDLVGGRVNIGLGKRKVLTHRIAAPRGLLAAGKRGPRITSATLLGKKTLRVVFVVNRSAGRLAVRVWITDRHKHVSK